MLPKRFEFTRFKYWNVESLIQCLHLHEHQGMRGGANPRLLSDRADGSAGESRNGRSKWRCI